MVGFRGNSGSPEMRDTEEGVARVLPKTRRSWCGREKIEVCGRLRCGGCGSERGETEGGGGCLSPKKWRDREKRWLKIWQEKRRLDFTGEGGDRCWLDGFRRSRC
ncbi:hypothetical protein HAX54_046900 [Datura stramonium]|uniref:Uncharacterized protein n=1 Tax=Datura stramonium TaxID=4076 RepID=A0ABS8WJY7_DATST|nr:hypothetical protein [Datura stramonium]